MSQSNILIIDDNHDLADGLGEVLEGEGFQVTLAYNGDDGITAFNAGHFDVALIDAKLPDMCGIALSQEIRQQDPRIRVIMMSGYRIEQILEEVIADGDVGIFRKPFDIERVLDVLGRGQKDDVVLVADADPDYARRLSAYLTDHDINALLVRNGQEAVDGVLSGPVEVLVLDLRMPIMYGLEVYLELKQRGQTVKTIIVAGYADEEHENVDILRSPSVTGCLFKPFRPEDMLRAIKRLMAH